MSNDKYPWDHVEKIIQEKARTSSTADMIKMGQVNELVVDSRSDYGLFLGKETDRVLLPNKYVTRDMYVGDRLSVFVYADSEDRPVATTQTPAGVAGDFVFLEARARTSFGTFMDWGLEKDLLVPKSEQQDSMTIGKKYLTRICLDADTQRLYGSTRISNHCDTDHRLLKKGQQVNLLIHAKTQLGITAVVDNRYYGMLYKNETYQPVSAGERCTGYIMRLRKDNKIDLTLKKPGYTSVKESARKIESILTQAGGFLPVHDKSRPDEINAIFSMSKKEFKRSVGRLYKKGVVVIKENGIALKS
jgi:predicted RNA-binding protein (virulence factor B family)